MQNNLSHTQTSKQQSVAPTSSHLSSPQTPTSSHLSSPQFPPLPPISVALRIYIPNPYTIKMNQILYETRLAIKSQPLSHLSCPDTPTPLENQLKIYWGQDWLGGSYVTNTICNKFQIMYVISIQNVKFKNYVLGNYFPQYKLEYFRCLHQYSTLNIL